MSATLVALTATLAAYYAPSDYKLGDAPALNLTELATDRWWGPEDKRANQDTAIHCARVTYEEDMVNNLKTKLARTRTNVRPLEGAAFTYGFNHKALANWTEYWLNQYDFDAREQHWNKYPLYKTNIQGLDIYYYRITPQVDKKTELIPLMILHGWPSSPLEFFDLVPLITAISEDRDFAIDLILPFLPGFGLSQGATRPGLGPAQSAIIMRNLMHRIGYKKFYVQGGDFGGLTFSIMATRFPDEVLGFHTNWGIILSPVAIFLQMVGALFPPLVAKKEVVNRMYPLQPRFEFLMTSTGSLHVHATKPDTVGAMLTESPIGLLGYLLDQYSAASPRPNALLEDGGLFESYDPDFLIDTLTLYWSTKSIQTSIRFYAEHFNIKTAAMRFDEIMTPVPTWLLAAPDELTYQSPVILSLKYKNLIGETILGKGGHFIAHQYPEVFVADVLKAITVFREWHAANGTDTSVV